jgi:D-alanyl-D-alanine carboxypeptidase
MLIAVEKIEAGELSLSDPVTVSAYAANMAAHSSIWKREKSAL